MIDNNLYFIRQYIEPFLETVQPEFEKIWSADTRVRYTSREEELIELQRNDISLNIVVVKSNFIRDFTGKEKTFIYEILRLITLQNSHLRYILYDLQELIRKRGDQMTDRYFYLRQLPDNLFAYELDCKVTPNTLSRRTYYRLLNSTFGRRKLSLFEVFKEYFITDIIEMNIKRAKKLVRHKGYRDHGALGSEYSKTLKQQSIDWSIRDKEKEREKDSQDLLDFLLGFSGFI